MSFVRARYLMDPIYLFCRTLDDIENVVENPDDYEILRASALLRQLLIDGNRLVDVVNREHRVKILFEIADSWDTPYAKVVLEDAPSFFGVLDGLYPGANPINAPIKKLDRDKFLTHAVIFVNGNYFTVRDIIDHCANVLGGVHVGAPRGRSQEALSGLKRISVGGASVSIRQLLPILQVVHKGLEPLTKRLKSSNKSMESDA